MPYESWEADHSSDMQYITIEAGIAWGAGIDSSSVELVRERQRSVSSVLVVFLWWVLVKNIYIIVVVEFFECSHSGFFFAVFVWQILLLFRWFFAVSICILPVVSCIAVLAISKYCKEKCRGDRLGRERSPADLWRKMNTRRNEHLHLTNSK